MYSRISKSVLVLSGQLKCNYDFIIKSNLGSGCKLLRNSIKHSGKSSFGALRYYCTGILPPDKNKVAETQLEEYLKDPENEKHWKVLQLEIEVLRQNGNLVPETMKPKHWAELIHLDTRNQRRRYLEFLFGLEKKKENRIEKQRIKREAHEESLIRDQDREKDPLLPPQWLEYRLGQNSPFLRFFETKMHHNENWRLLRAMMYGQKIVMDCGYEDKMSRGERRNCARQLMLSFAANRENIDPFDLYYCNFDIKNDMYFHFHSFIPSIHEPDFPINITEKSYLDIFDKSQLVYLTPNCNNELKDYDPDAIYIIGAIVDKGGGYPLSMAKAKKEGLKMAKLPIDNYLHFGGGGNKSLTLNQMISIMLDLKNTNDWPYALRHVPRRKLAENRQRALEFRVNNYMKKNEQQAEMFNSRPPLDFSIEGRKKLNIK